MNNKILIYLGHPAQYHFFKNIIKLLKKEKVEIKIAIKTKDVLEKLLIEDKMDYINVLPKPRNSNKLSILWALIRRFVKLFTISVKFKPNLLIGTDASISWVGYILKIHAVTVLEDDEDIIKELSRLTFPYTNAIVVPESCEIKSYTHKVIKYSGYMKLSYLHPNYINNFNKPDKIFLIRLSSLNAYHDNNIRGINRNILKDVLEILNNYGKVFISSEEELPINLREYQLVCKASEIHDYIKKSYLIISDSQSMTVEAAILGIPNIRYSDFVGSIGVLNELEYKYKLSYGIRPDNQEELINKINELINEENIFEIFQKRRIEMLNDKIDVSSFFSWFIYEFPKSFDIMKSKPNYQDRFKL